MIDPLMAHSRPDLAAASDPTVPAASPASDKLRCEGDPLQLAASRLIDHASQNYPLQPSNLLQKRPLASQRIGVKRRHSTALYGAVETNDWRVEMRSNQLLSLR